MRMVSTRYLVTGSMGCLGAWTLAHLVREGKPAVSFDLSTNRHRLDLLLSREEQAAITFVQGDLGRYDQVEAVFRDYGVTHVVHLAALQVPFCRADPVTGAQVNVVGTVNIFQAARQFGLKHLAYASSIAVYGPPDRYPAGLIAPDAPIDPHTLYGVYKQANEGTARVYWEENQLSSVALRPYTVYGLGRDQGLTSDPTKAMLAAAAGKPFHIGFGGTMQFQWASDVARYFIAAAETPSAGAAVYNLGTPPATVQQVAQIIRDCKPGADITVEDRHLPFPAGFDDTPLKQYLPSIADTPLADGIRQTIDAFEQCLADGRLTLD
jgi:UDP-glucuronate 4-epimerase